MSAPSPPGRPTPPSGREPAAPAAPPAPPAAPAPALDEDALGRLQDLLHDAPAGLEPLDLGALDGYLCGVLLQPRPVPAPQWLAHALDADGRPAPAGAWRDELTALLQRRHAELSRAIAERAWFDPWLEAIEPNAPLGDAVLPWVAGFAIAMDHFPALMALDDPALIEPLALLYLHFDPDDLEEADRLLEAIDEIEPPADLADAAQDLVRAVLLMADVSQPRKPRPGASAKRHPRSPSGAPRRR